ncbi:glycerol-3-phosphate dehydrogenase/oxidase [Rubritalea spongiae]|uniref:Glycerol-3-phosphate dehydrogenase/oxidase n=1 Tax=Rubritalea spongiae TaxID=430797 RepID=A0ABW5E1Y6_9BACT
MNTTDPRQKLIAHAQQDTEWDIIIIGGGATGLATAWDAATRGYKVALLEKEDFAAATSSRSTKLVHGGVRYLQNGELGLVKEALHERSLLIKNAAEFCHPQRFILPTHAPLARYYYRLGMAMYDLLAGKANIQTAELLNPIQLQRALPGYRKKKPTGGIAYSDGQFDDAALCVAFAQAINANNGLAINYLAVEKLISKKGKIKGVIAKDQETSTSWKMRAKAVVNATGIFSDIFRKQNDSIIQWSIRTSRGSHIVVPEKILGSDNALIIPETSDGRVLFAIPWKQHTLIGTTDVPTDTPTLHPTPSNEEIQFLIEEASNTFDFEPKSISSSWSGLRPLVSRANKGNTASLSRKHILDIAPDGLISILGGKWTTCRKMAEDTINAVIATHKLPQKACNTESLKLCEHGALPPAFAIDQSPADSISPQLVADFFHNHYARSADDILARRTRMAMLNTKIAQDQSARITDSLAKLKQSPAPL